MVRSSSERFDQWAFAIDRRRRFVHEILQWPRTHPSLEKDAPISRAVDRAGHFLVVQLWAYCITNMPGLNLR
jgi:hypothetical protein